jgi:nucleoid DNA-binding protein
MNKADFVEMLSAKLDGSKAEAEKALNAVLDGITEALTTQGQVAFVGFGTFKVAERAARTGRNPRTGEEIQIPAMKAVTFKVGKALKDEVNK